jgi:hypothetical protein
MPSQFTIPPDQVADYTLRKEGFRLDIDNRAFQGLLILNGGGAVALLAFLQAILNKDTVQVAHSMAAPIVMALWFLVMGLPLAVIHQALRARTSLAMQSNSEWYQLLRWCGFGCFYLSCVSFALGMGQLLIRVTFLIP